MMDFSSPLMQRLRWLPIAIGGIWLTVGWINIIQKPRGDFPCHWEFGRRILAGEYIYKDNLCSPNPPFRALADAPLALMSLHTAQIVTYVLAPLAIAVLLWTLHQLSKKQLPLDRDRLFWSTTLAIVLASHFLSRDLPEVGVNTALVALSWVAIYFWSQGRDGLGGVSLGLAAALKCTPLLFFAYFALRRQWRMVVVSAVAFGVFTLSPVLLQGPDQYAQAMRAWVVLVAHGTIVPDPSRGPIDADKVESLALRQALTRYVMHLPYGHLGRPETSDVPERPHQPPNPLYLQFGDLSPYWAGIAVQTIMAGLLLAVVWLCRQEIGDRHDPIVLWECAIVSLLILLYSPMTWKQHAVGVLPALYLICRYGWTSRPIPRWAFVAVTLYAIIVLLLNREFIGRDMVKLIDSYHMKTLAILLLGGATLGCRHALRTAKLTSDVK